MSAEDAALEGPMVLTSPGSRTFAPHLLSRQSRWIDQVFARIPPGLRRPNLLGGSLQPAGRRWPAVQSLEAARPGPHRTWLTWLMWLMLLIHGRSPPWETLRCLPASLQSGRRPPSPGTCPSATGIFPVPWGVPGGKNLSELQPQVAPMLWTRHHVHLGCSNPHPADLPDLPTGTKATKASGSLSQ